MEGSIKAAAYCRFSSENQRDESIDAQIRAIEIYAKSKEISITKFYIDRAKSATSDKRPEFQQMILDSALGIFDVVICHKLDRFSRDKFVSVTYKRKLNKNGVRIISVTENLDGSPESVILESLLEGMAEYYSKNLAREVMKGQFENAYKCQHTGGRPPLGFNVDKESRKLIINESESIIVKLIFSLYNQGYGYGYIIDELNSKGLKTKLGASFGKNSLYEILNNEKYSGVYVYNRKSNKNVIGRYNSHLKKENAEIVKIDGGCPEIIFKEDFLKAQARMQTNKVKAGTYRAKEVYLLSGLAFCGSCGSPMQGNSRIDGKKREIMYASYKCGNKNNKHLCDNKEIKREQVESFVLSQLEKKIFNNIPLLVEKLNEFQKTKASLFSIEIKALEVGLKDVESKIANIVKAVSNGLFQESFKLEMSRLEEEKSKIEISIIEINQKQPRVVITEDLLKKVLSSFQKSVREKSIMECKEFVQNYIEKVLVFPDRVEAIFKIMLEGSNGYTVKSGISTKKLKKLATNIA